MDINERLKGLLSRQKELLREYEEAIKEFDYNDLINENRAVREELDKCRKELEEAQKLCLRLKLENDGLRTSLKEQMLDEKLNILKISSQKLETYFRKTSDRYSDELTRLTFNVQQRLDELTEASVRELGNEAADINQEISALSSELQERIRIRKERYRAAGEAVMAEAKKAAEEIAGEPITEEMLKKRMRQNSIELKIGLGWVNRIGILLILIGVSAALRYTYINFFTNEMKGIFVFILGFLLLAGGELFNRRERNTFALGLTGGGIGVLYAAIFHSYFNLEIINMNAALVISMITTAAAIILSLRYNSRTISAFSLVGGFLPFFSYTFAFGLEGMSIYIAMGYLLILNLIALLISFSKKWSLINYISFILNVPTLLYLAFSAPLTGIGITYAVVTFAMYLAVSLAYPFMHKIALKAYDVVLIGANTAVSCIVIYMLFDKAGLNEFRGLLAVLFCLAYFGLGQFTQRFIKAEKSARVLFYLTSYTFAVLAVPFQLGVRWFAMGWLVESVFMVIYGFKHRIRYMEIGGWVILGLCLFGFMGVDFIVYNLFSRSDVPYFHLRFLSIMAGLVGILFNYLIGMKGSSMLKYSARGQLVILYKYAVAVGLWLYALYTAADLYDLFVVRRGFLMDHRGFFRIMLLIAVTYIAGYTFIKIPLVHDKVMKCMSSILFVLANLVLFIVTLSQPVFRPAFGGEKYAALVLLIVFNIFAFVNVRELVISFIRSTGINIEVYPILVSVYLLASVTVLLSVQFDLGRVNLLFSLLYVVAALSFIIYGFMRRYVMMRRFGLALSILSTGKLFIYDLAYLDTSGRIISYFVFGIVLVGISYLYQRFSKTFQDYVMK